MSVKTVAYYCQNCEKRFELTEGQIPRCPNCFWTTSIRRLDEMETPASQSRGFSKAAKSGGKKLSPKIFIALLIILAVGLLMVVLPSVFKKENLQRTWSAISTHGVWKHGPSKQKDGKTTIPAPFSKLEPTSTDPLSLLSQDERYILASRIAFGIPRKLTPDETQMLSKRVDFSIDVSQPPQFKFWTLEAFDNALSNQQKKRGIYFSGGYENSLRKLFKNHYLKAGEALNAGQLLESRDELLNSLLFPLYQNNPRLHKSVALVMLQEFINEVLGKIQVLNSYLMTQGLSESITQVRKDYGSLFSLIDAQNWDEAFALSQKLESQAKSIDDQTKQSTGVQYPSIVAQIDADVQKGLFMQDQATIPISTGLGSLLADLRIKKKAFQQNTAQALQPMKDKYESALSAIREHRWQDAKSALESIEFPMEVLEDAKQKLAILSKLPDHAETKEPAPSSKTQ